MKHFSKENLTLKGVIFHNLKELLGDKESNYWDARRRIDELSLERKEKIVLGFTEVKLPFNHNYSIMPNIITCVDDLLLKSDRRCDFATGSNKPVPLTADPIVIDLNDSNSSEACAECVSVSGSREKNMERNATGSIDCSNRE
ncbi:hypothetical protein R6Q57_019583 [Mikania cordata]